MEVDMSWYEINRTDISWTWMRHPEYIKAKELALKAVPCKWNKDKYQDDNWWKRKKWIIKYCEEHRLYCSSNGLDYNWRTDSRPNSEKKIITYQASLSVGYDYIPYKDKLYFEPIYG